MKRNVRLFALLACLLITALVFAVPVFATADVADGATNDTTGETNGTTDVIPDEEESSGAIDINFDIARFVDSLQYMWKGMLCIFIVIGVIILVTYMFNRFVNYLAFKNDNK